MYPLQLTQHFSWEEAEATIHRNIDNTIPESLWDTIINTAHGMERIRSLLMCPVIPSSWYRCLELNRAIGSDDTSQHIKGEAVDWTCPKYGTPIQICNQIIKFADHIKFDQLILEHRWVHTSFAADGNNRGQVLSLLKERNPETGRHYADGLTDQFGNKYYA